VKCLRCNQKFDPFYETEADKCIRKHPDYARDSDRDFSCRYGTDVVESCSRCGQNWAEDGISPEPCFVGRHEAKDRTMVRHEFWNCEEEGPDYKEDEEGNMRKKSVSRARAIQEI